MSAECFIGTNLFIYQLEASDERKAATADRIIRKGIQSHNACISFQVVQECLNTVLRKAEIPLSTDETKQYLDNVLHLCTAYQLAFHSTVARSISKRATAMASTTRWSSQPPSIRVAPGSTVASFNSPMPSSRPRASASVARR